MLFRFTLQNDILGSLVINEPDGWKEARLKLERDQNFHSLIEYFDGSFIFYGDNGQVNGGIDYINEVEETQGFDAIINILIDVSFDGYTYFVCFYGQLNIALSQRFVDNKIQIPIVRDGFWSKFINRLDTPVNIQSELSLDDEQIDQFDSVNLSLTSQKVRYNGQYTAEDGSFYTDATEKGMLFNWENVIVDDLNKFSLVQGTFAVTPPYDTQIGIIEAPYDGTYRIQVGIVSAVLVLAVFPATLNYWDAQSANFEMRVRITDSTSYEIGTNSVETVGANSYLITTFDKTFQLIKGQQIAIYGIQTGIQRVLFGERRLTWLQPDADLATTTTIVLSGEQVIDGTLTSSSRVLVKNQGSQEENGIYVSGAGAWTRATDLDAPSEFTNAAIFVAGGDQNLNSTWRQTEIVGTVGIDSINWIVTYDGSLESLVPYDGSEVHNYLTVTADTTYKKTNAFSFLAHDVAGQICDRIISQNQSFYSDLLGSSQTIYRQYDADGCHWKYTLTKGLQLRQYSLIEKPFSMSFNQFWKGINPVLCLGLGYEEVNGSQVVRIEGMDDFYDASSTSLDISNVRQITRSYDQSIIFKTVKVGYSKWKSEDISGIDDAQTKHTYATRFVKTGTDLTLESDFIAASLAIETTRRQTKTKSADYKFDDDTFLIAINPTPVDMVPETSPDVVDYVPELDENFSSIDNLLSPETRYNSRITPARNLMRWIRFISGCLQSYLESNLKFVSGEGNYDMTSDMINTSDGCSEIKTEVSEKENLPVYDDPLHLAMLYEIVIPLEWEDYLTIRENRKKAIGISQTSSGHVKFFIESLEYELVQSRATIKAWPIEFFEIAVINEVPEMRACVPVVVATCEDSYLTEDSFEYETENGQCLILN